MSQVFVLRRSFLKETPLKCFVNFLALQEAMQNFGHFLMKFLDQNISFCTQYAKINECR